MKKLRIKEMSSIALVCTMMIGMLPTAFAQKFEQGRVVEDDFNTFTEYTASKDSQNNIILPSGWKLSSDGKSSASFTAYKDTEETNTNAFSFGWLGKPVYSFSEVIKSGKLRVSFDVKTSANLETVTSTPSLWVRSHTLDIDTTHNVEDYYYHLDSSGNEKDSQKYVVGEKMSTFFRLQKNNLRHYSLNSGKGAFELSINLGNLTNKDIKCIKAFLWDNSTYAPRVDELSYKY